MRQGESAAGPDRDAYSQPVEQAGQHRGVPAFPGPTRTVRGRPLPSTAWPNTSSPTNDCPGNDPYPYPNTA